MAGNSDLLLGFELHSEEIIRRALAAGADAAGAIDGKPAVQILQEMYTRSPRFAACLRIMLDAGATLHDLALEAVLLDDVSQLAGAVEINSDSLYRRRWLECAYSSLYGVSLLHVAAEYNSVKAAKYLLAQGIDVDVAAEIDAEGLGGHTPTFHTVNSNQNNSRQVMELLVESGASLDVRLKGLVWGGDFEWETVVYDVSLISYAQCGLYFQFHRPESQIYSNLGYLYQRRYGVPLTVRNVPNKYLLDEKVYPPRT
jgi:hypothetical protein